MAAFADTVTWEGENRIPACDAQDYRPWIECTS